MDETREIRRIAINTGGGDAPGLNAVIRAIVLSAVNRGWEVVGIEHGYGGLLPDDTGEVISLGGDAVRGITHRGGTILGTTNRSNPFAWPARLPDGTIEERDRSGEIIESVRRHGIDALIAIGGDGSLHIALKLFERGLPMVGIPKTIDNDLHGTSLTFGFLTAVETATDAIGRLHSTAESHRRVMVVELMGRHAGWIALYSGLAGTADVILIPEIPYRIEKVCDKIRQRDAAGRDFSIVCVAEGAMPVDGAAMLKTVHGGAGDQTRLGGLGDLVAREISSRTGKETRSIVLGHLQRGGAPISYDRVMSLRFGAAAVRCVARGEFGTMVGLDPPTVKAIPLAEALANHKSVPVDGDIVATARDLGVSFGD
ncbi:6-phosphofructokinase [Candidatus Palauibacter sp.]|uniref:6-phosphofructokinase n=1 Tax=Candidatus Palauibacter sp. TaxID=3101350 RepID=UPI003B5CEFA1